ncbi:MAG: carbohydrate kinase [Lewinellaceae bacterium]|nr:carbohydrate kinase [Lewinellaceae bacterium]
MQDNQAPFDAFQQVTVLIVGDVMIDRYLKGTVTRISPEAPVPVVDWREVDDRLGGAANVARNIQALGATPLLCGVVGQDADGDRFCTLAQEQGLSTRGIIQSTERVTTVKTRVLAGSQQLIRLDREDSRDLTAKEEKKLLKQIRELMDSREIQVVLLQDYNKGVLSTTVIREVVLEAVKRDIPTAVDPKFRNFWAFKRVTLFKPNLKEIREQLPQGVEPNEASLQAAAAAIRKKLGNQYTMITLSDKGLFLDLQGESILVPTQPRAIADVSGAGDTVISVVAVGLALGMKPYELALLANLAGGQVCERLGVVPVDKDQLWREYKALVTVS